MIENNTVSLYNDVRKNYFKIFLCYSYFNIAKWFYLRFGFLIPYIILIPVIFNVVVTFGLIQEIARDFEKVESNFQFVVNSWITVIEFISVCKRLKQFEKEIKTNKYK